MACYDLTNLTVNKQGSCISPSDFDKLCNYKSNNPFTNLSGPPNGSKISVYWKNGSVKAPLKSLLTFSDYMTYVNMAKGSKLVKLTGELPPGNSYKGKNKLNNPGNLSYGKIAKLYNSTGSEKKADGQPCAIFPDMKHGLAATMHYLRETYNGQNMCQINSKYQGYVEKDCSYYKDPYGMAALRLRWVTNNCSTAKAKPGDQFDLNDKNTLMLLTNAITKIENSITFQKGFMEEAYQLLKK